MYCGQLMGSYMYSCLQIFLIYLELETEGVGCDLPDVGARTESGPLDEQEAAFNLTTKPSL